MIPQHVVSHGGDIPWPACSSHLSACDYFLWSHFKGNVSIFKTRTIEELRQRIKEEIAAIPEQMTHRVMENLGGRLEQCLRNGGGHLNDEIFKNKMACNEFFSDNNIYVVR